MLADGTPQVEAPTRLYTEVRLEGVFPSFPVATRHGDTKLLIKMGPWLVEIARSS
jgi:hypothetical protein